MKKRNGYKKDFDLRQGLVAYALFAVIALAVVLIGVIGVFALSKLSEGNSNELAEHFNALSQPERALLAEWNGYEVDEAYLMSSKTVCFGEYIGIFTNRGVQIGFLVIVSLLTFWFYSDTRKEENFFLADLPERGVRGIILLILFWAGCPFLLGSLVQMKRWEAEAIDKQQEELATSRIEEGDDEMDVMPQPEGLVTNENGCVTYEDRSIDRTHFAEDSYAQFEKYCQIDTQEAYKEWLCEMKTHICDTESKLRKAGERVKALQKELKKARADLEGLKAGGPSTVKSLETIRADWEAIKKMRGVVDIYYDDYELKIAVEVRVPYSGEIYDFGDYIIAITNDNNITCYRNRSGIRSDWTDSYPDYCYDDGTFCLGDREYVIKEYLKQHRLREAVILTIDCLHSVNNDEDAEDIPNCFRKVVSPKEG